MKKTKVENVSGLKLDFFLKQDKKDVRVVLMPGESSWCDHESTTKSMILYERKKLLKVSTESSVLEKKPSEGLLSVKPMSEPSGQLFYLEPIYKEQPSLLEKAQQETEEYKQQSEKKYKGKKRGRKKKRGPKPGSKRKKTDVKLPENPPDNNL